MRLYLSRLHFPVTTLGPGRRVGIWFQGCSLHCPGCISVDTWAHGRGKTTVEAVLEALEPWWPDADGVTVSGGEPFQQPEALAALLHGLRARASAGCDLLLYSGYPWGKIEPQVRAWPGLVDALISEPFHAGEAQTRPWRGSANQRLHLLTELGRERFGPWVEADCSALPPALDVFFDQGEVWMAGIPAPGMLERLRESLAAVGFGASTSQGATVRSRTD